MVGQSNVTLIGMADAKFDSLQINSIDYAPVDTSVGSLLTVKGFKVDGQLFISAADEYIIVDSNEAAQITVKTNSSTDNIDVRNNTLTGGEEAKAPQLCGVYIVPNVTGYDLSITGNTFSGIKKHAIHVQGGGDGDAVTAANSITVTGNTFTSYNLKENGDYAAFKIWKDTELAASQSAALTDAAKALANDIEANNTFDHTSTGIGTGAVLADFFDTQVQFSND